MCYVCPLCTFAAVRCRLRAHCCQLQCRQLVRWMPWRHGHYGHFIMHAYDVLTGDWPVSVPVSLRRLLIFRACPECVCSVCAVCVLVCMLCVCVCVCVPVVVACSGSCATCSSSPFICTSCVAGTFKNGTTCRSTLILSHSLLSLSPTRVHTHLAYAVTYSPAHSMRACVL